MTLHPLLANCTLTPEFPELYNARRDSTIDRGCQDIGL